LKQVTQTELITRRRSLLEVLVLRFDPPSSLYRQIEQELLNFTDVALLKKLLAAAVQSEDMTAFQSIIDQCHYLSKGTWIAPTNCHVICKHPEPKSKKKILNPKKEYDNLPKP